jgi:hypothetical protein
VRDAEQHEQARADRGDLGALHADGGPRHPLDQSAHRAEGTLGAMPVLAVLQEILVALGGLAFVSLLLFLFVLVARFLAPRVLGKDDGSSRD